MKKSLFLIMIVSLLLVGCSKESSVEKEKQTTKSTTTTTTITTTTVTTTTTTKTTKKKTTTKKPTTAKATTTTKKSTTAKKLGENEYISTVDGKAHKYSFIYSDKATCEAKSKADAPYKTVFPVKPYVATRCEEAKDLSGKSFWGLVYFEQAGDNSDEKIKFYY